jgi:hypothetical protein
VLPDGIGNSAPAATAAVTAGRQPFRSAGQCQRATPRRQARFSR